MSSPPSPQHLVEATAADHDVVTVDVVEIEQIEVVARRAILRTDLDPVVTLVAERRQVGLGAEDEVVALAGEGLARRPRR